MGQHGHESGDYMRLQTNIVNLWLLATVALAAPRSRADTLPEITWYSDRSFSVYQGDTLAVAVKASGNELEAKWFKGPTVFCRSLNCSIDTSQWEIGRHRLVVVVFNKAGSKFIRYDVRIIAAPEGHRPIQVHPDMIPATNEAETTNAYDLTVKSLHGRGYSYHQKKLQILGPLPRALDWTEALRTSRRGALDFGRVGVEAHTLTSNSAVRLLNSEQNRRAIILKRGTLRSRSLGTKDPRWSVVIPDLAQIDTDAQGDVLITRTDVVAPKIKAATQNEVAPSDKAEGDATAEGEQESTDPEEVRDSAATNHHSQAVTITVLRGYARVFVRNKGPQKGDDAGSAVIVGPGLSLTVRPDEEPDSPGLPDIKMTAALVAETSPQYLPGRWEEGVANGLAFTAGAPKTKTFAEAMAAATLLRGDPTLVLEVLLPKYAEAKTAYQAQLALGEAYKALYLFKSAASVLKTAAELKPDAPEPEFLLGEMALLMQDWSKAERYLDKARDKDAPDTQKVNYELGVAAYFAKDSLVAAAAFDRALWTEDGSPEIATSARAFRQLSNPLRWYELRANAGVFYDSNILHSDSVDVTTLGYGLKAKKGAGYEGSFGFSLWPWRTPSFGTELAWDGGKTAFFNKAFSPVARIDQTLAIRFNLGFGGGDGPKYVALGLGVFARTLAVGGQSSINALGGVVTLSSPASYDLRLSARPTTAVDTLPAHSNIVDPLLWEVVDPGDRSSKLVYYGLGITPVRNEHIRLDLDLNSGRTTYHSVFAAPESYRLIGLTARLDYTSTPRSIWSAGIADTKRTFSSSADQRKDNLVGLIGAWRWYFVPALSQTMEIDLDKQKSSRAANGYKRLLIAYRLNFSL